MDSEQDSLDALRQWYEGLMTPDDLADDGAQLPGNTSLRPVAPTTSNTVAIRPRGLICLQGPDGSPLAGQPYAVDTGDTPLLGSTDERGWIELVDVTSVSKATLHVGEVAYALTFGPELTDTPTLVQSLLNALGYSAGPLDGNLQARTRFALACYQFKQGTVVTGTPDDDTVDALKRDVVVQE
jgi:hypothetical protein